MADIKIVLKEIGFKDVDWTHLAHNWRANVSTEMNLPVPRRGDTCLASERLSRWLHCLITRIVRRSMKSRRLTTFPASESPRGPKLVSDNRTAEPVRTITYVRYDSIQTLTILTNLKRNQVFFSRLWNTCGTAKWTLRSNTNRTCLNSERISHRSAILKEWMEGLAVSSTSKGKTDRPNRRWKDQLWVEPCCGTM